MRCANWIKLTLTKRVRVCNTDPLSTKDTHASICNTGIQNQDGKLPSIKPV